MRFPSRSPALNRPFFPPVYDCFSKHMWTFQSGPTFTRPYSEPQVAFKTNGSSSVSIMDYVRNSFPAIPLTKRFRVGDFSACLVLHFLPHGSYEFLFPSKARKIGSALGNSSDFLVSCYLSNVLPKVGILYSITFFELRASFFQSIQLATTIWFLH